RDHGDQRRICIPWPLQSGRAGKHDDLRGRCRQAGAARRVGGRNGIGNRPVVGGRDGYRWLAAANPSQPRVAQSGKAHAPDGAQRGLARRAPPLQPGRLLRRPASRFSAKAEEELRNSVPRHEEAFMSMAIAQQTYIVESRELLRDMENALLRLEKTPQDAEAITAVFRAAHTIKGSSGAFNFE